MPEAEIDVLGDRLVGKQRVILKHQADVPLIRRLGGDVLAADLDRSGGRSLEARDDAEQRRLAAAARADERNEFALAHVERDVLERADLVEGLADIPHADGRRGGRALSMVFGGNHASPATRAASAGARYHRRAATTPSADTLRVTASAAELDLGPLGFPRLAVLLHVIVVGEDETRQRSARIVLGKGLHHSAGRGLARDRGSSDTW